jgi:hypothetical protein
LLATFVLFEHEVILRCPVFREGESFVKIGSHEPVKFSVIVGLFVAERLELLCGGDSIGCLFAFKFGEHPVGPVGGQGNFVEYTDDLLGDDFLANGWL